MGWCFAIINNRLAEIFLGNNDKRKKSEIFAHCYVKREKYKTKREQKWIDQDTAKNRFSYRLGKYRLMS